MGRHKAIEKKMPGHFKIKALPAKMASELDARLMSKEKPGNIVLWLKKAGWPISGSVLFYRRKALRALTGRAKEPKEPLGYFAAMKAFDRHMAKKFKAFKKGLATSQPKTCMCGAANANELGFCPACAATVERAIPQLKEARL